VRFPHVHDGWDRQVHEARDEKSRRQTAKAMIREQSKTTIRFAEFLEKLDPLAAA
jgi:hypothetical protein